MTSSPISPRVLPLDKLEGIHAGGKANGLYRLIKLGFAVPPGFVLLDIEPGSLPVELGQYYSELGGGLVAVRSSALDEDGSEASFAGQYETVLNVEGAVALQQAVERCLVSLQSQRAAAYRGDAAGAVKMCVVVQRMVNARTAGVLFTADPVSARRDRLVIDAVCGLGEALVSGEATPDHYELDLQNNIVIRDLVDVAAPVLSDTEILQLTQQARDAAARFGEPLDTEWAIDQDGKIFWLQARPVTTLPADLNEFDSGCLPTDVMTTGNIGEMMPGAVCPLTMSVTLRGIEYAFQQLDVRLGAQKAVETDYKQVCSFYGHWFFNLSGKVAAGGHIAGMSAKEAGYSICGEEIPQLHEPPRQSWWVRARGGFRFFNNLRYSETVVDQFESRLQREFRTPFCDTPQEQIAQINTLLWWILEVENVHVLSSSSSAVAGGILQGVIAKGERPTQEQLGELAHLMAGATGVISAELVQELDVVVEHIATTHHAARFSAEDAQSALQWLQSSAAGAVRELFAAFLARHGHRAYRELCVREKGWAEDPLPLIRTMQVSVRAMLGEAPKKTVAPHIVDISQYNGFVRWLLPRVHNGIRRRERTKSLLVFITREVGKAYRHLGGLLVEKNILPDGDLICFFTHEELLACKGIPSVAQITHALKRREAMAYQNRLQFPFLCQGKPQPLSVALVNSDTGVLTGRPVSAGCVEGVCRVALSPEEATQLQPGEILIAPITDVAWTPYFSVIAGLATDIGSSVSHGAVIAREYGLPAVVNLRSASTQFRTGDRVRLDGGKGTLELLAASH
ncbi:MAG TPA: PEP/pyruvate-binding domain-containing protein [Pseudomonadales bacterium]|nr:PEP/pyruvate-binding domain-containing protein [Pseudomonadales bacterium]